MYSYLLVTDYKTGTVCITTRSGVFANYFCHPKQYILHILSVSETLVIRHAKCISLAQYFILFVACPSLPRFFRIIKEKIAGKSLLTKYMFRISQQAIPQHVSLETHFNLILTVTCKILEYGTCHHVRF
jgi:hypothetical protein